LDADLVPVLVALAEDQPLHPRQRDHDLIGNWASYRECHVKPDLARTAHFLVDFLSIRRTRYIPLLVQSACCHDRRTIPHQ
ncbi:MAG: type II toxin-antitoxin system mRNA interferase toxin, RelE/StbE family, partial [Leptothrix ochracea]|uniref:type II toxin-antitoxin system mRNA interferase toxin, RelE/StbE family n=1 Tax=Leptothrix ochracea TaxID=735331 RepID=UPI0034E21396